MLAAEAGDLPYGGCHTGYGATSLHHGRAKAAAKAAGVMRNVDLMQSVHDIYEAMDRSAYQSVFMLGKADLAARVQCMVVA